MPGSEILSSQFVRYPLMLLLLLDNDARKLFGEHFTFPKHYLLKVHSGPSGNVGIGCRQLSMQLVDAMSEGSDFALDLVGLNSSDGCRDRLDRVLELPHAVLFIRQQGDGERAHGLRNLSTQYGQGRFAFGGDEHPFAVS